MGVFDLFCLKVFSCCGFYVYLLDVSDCCGVCCLGFVGWLGWLASYVGFVGCRAVGLILACTWW